jgi:hypothetical protein
MKIYRILCLGAAAIVAPLALANLPFTNEAFGKIEGTLDFCVQADPQATAEYEERKQLLVRDVPEKEMDEARQTQDYQDAHEWVSAALGKIPKAQAAKACGDFLKGK